MDTETVNDNSKLNMTGIDDLLEGIADNISEEEVAAYQGLELVEA